MKNSKKLSLSSIGAIAFTLGSIIPASAQSLQAETLQNLNFRNGPGTNYSIITTLKKGSIVKVIKNLNTWTMIKYKGTVGYVSSDYLKNVSVNNNTNPETLTLMECNISDLNIRKSPSISDSIIGKLNKTDRIYVVYQTNNGWSRIKYNGGYGYINSKYISKVTENSTSTTMQCNTDSLNIRKGPSSSEKIVGQLKYGDKVSVVINLTTNWTKINFNGEYAYVSTKYLSESVQAPSNSTFMKCNASILNIRSEPSQSENILGTLKKGDKIEIIYHLNSGWSRIKFYRNYGYVNTSYLTSF
ncbi:MAG: SH3 domain-containing protein [Romboutsia sp.]|uniref:SH3 domain-containing protein n=1 Tax=Romboutsia sp. TaxID=1965302 RepID=UPI003F40088E